MKGWLIPLGSMVVVVVGVLLVGDRATTAEPTKPVQWEYKVMSYVGVAELGGSKGGATAAIRHVELGLNKLGEDGWELVAVSGNIGSNGYYHLKRPKTR
jgi:hypothetical protein